MKKYMALLLSLCILLTGSINSLAAPDILSGPGAENTRIYISKIAKVLSLYHNGREVGRWDCAIGKLSENGDKKVEGDYTTPSGSFYICTRNDQSVCYLSLGLSYPSTDDAKRGYESGIISLEEKEAIEKAIANKKCPPWNTALGGEIMIHGDYQDGVATRGCVAVPNEVMDILWQYAALGVRVDIGP